MVVHSARYGEAGGGAGAGVSCISACIPYTPLRFQASVQYCTLVCVVRATSCLC